MQKLTPAELRLFANQSGFTVINLKAYTKNNMAMKYTWNRTCSPIHPGAACIDYHTNRSGRTSKEADGSAFFSPSSEIDIRIPHRASTRLSCLFPTVVEIVTLNVCVWNNRRYAKHHPGTVYAYDLLFSKFKRNKIKTFNGHRNADKRANSFWQFLHFFHGTPRVFTMLADRQRVPIALTQFCPCWNLLDISVFCIKEM